MSEPTSETALVPVDAGLAEFELSQRVAKLYAASGYWKDTPDMARAFVKIAAGRSLGLPPMLAMSEVHVIEGKPELGAGALSALVKASGKYDYRVVTLTERECLLRFFDTRTGEAIGDSRFTWDDAVRAKLDKKDNYQKYPRNMLFARAISNGVAFHCSDVTMGRVYVEGEIDTDDRPPVRVPELPEEAEEISSQVVDVPTLDATSEYDALTELVEEEAGEVPA